jgi:hypothetical protein
MQKIASGKFHLGFLHIAEGAELFERTITVDAFLGN